MTEQLRPSETRAAEHVKYRNAALKAWVTIKRKKREAGSQGIRRIEDFVPPNSLGSINHPEALLLEETNKDSFGKGLVKVFQKTPEDIVCGRFWELRWAFGCPLDCNYCYLRGTMRGRMRPSFVKTEHVLAALDEAFAQIKKPSLFNSGELSDSLMNPFLMAKIADKFETQENHKLVTLSKFGPRAVGFLIERARKQVVCAWSINCFEVAKKWERAAATPDKRIEAARLVAEAGYDTRVRIDPIFPVDNWQAHYEDLLYAIFSAFEPRRIILGTPRGLWKTISYARSAGVDMSWSNYFKEDSGWGKKLDFKQRKQLYSWFYDKLNSLGYDRRKVTMCKETREMWEALNVAYTPLTCQCYGPQAYHS